MVNKGKTYEILCRKGFNRDNCKFRMQDSELHCSICSFAGFRERKKVTEQTQTEKTEDG